MDIPPKLLQPQLAPYATAIGALCLKWSELESDLRMLFVTATRMPTDGRASFGIAASLDLRDSLAAIKIVLVDRGPMDGATEIAIGVIDFIDNVLRPRRNRLIHDSWTFRRDEETQALIVERIDWTPKIRKDQAFAARTWKHLAFTEEAIDELWNFIAVCQEMARETYRIQGLLTGDPAAKEELLRSPPQLHLAPRPPGMQNQTEPV